MKRALHMASDVDAYARLVFYVAIGWSSLPFSGWCDWPQNNNFIIRTLKPDSVSNSFGFYEIYDFDFQ